MDILFFNQIMKKKYKLVIFDKKIKYFWKEIKCLIWNVYRFSLSYCAFVVTGVVSWQRFLLACPELWTVCATNRPRS